MTRRQRGAALLIPVLFIITVAAFAAMVAARRSVTEIQGSEALADNIEALYLAESGMEHALKRFATGAAACGAGLGQTLTSLTTIGLGTTGRTITIGTGLTTDFSGNTLPATRCRIPVTATITASNVSRTLHAIVDRNLLEGPDNPTFDNPSAVGPPSAWTLNPVDSYTAAGGADCSRSAWLLKDQQNNVTAQAQLTVPVSFTVAAGSTTSIQFNWRLLDRTPNGCNNGVASGPAFPAGCPGNAGDNQTCFRLVPTAAGGVVTLQKNTSVGVAVACPAGVDPGTPSVWLPCNSQYQLPASSVAETYPLKELLTVAMGGGAVTSFEINMRLRNAGRKEFFLDSVEVTNPTAIGAARVQVWRDCSTAANPATCL